MHYVAIVEGTEREVEVIELAPDRYQLVMEGRTLEVDARAISDTTLSLLLDGQAYDIESEQAPTGGENVLVRGHVVNVQVFDLRTMRLRRAQFEAVRPEGPVAISAPMPGKVVAVLVQDGDTVTSGQGLLVVEAMKMENELRSPRDGVVRNIAVEAGVAVESGARLCTVE